MSLSADASGLQGITFTSTSSYQIVEELGRGGMGIVFLAEKLAEGVRDYVVLKTLRTINEDQVGKLKREANIATHLRHDNIVKTYGLEAIPRDLLPADFQEQLRALAPRYMRQEIPTGNVYRPRLAPPGQGPTPTRHLDIPKQPGATAPLHLPRKGPLRDDEKLYCLVMDYISGTDLGHIHNDHVRAGLLLPPILVAFLVSRLARALAYAHQYVVHRDISPENILIDVHGVAKLTDFGIALAIGESQTFAGKLLYLSPEQLRNEGITPQGDIFSLGLVAYQLLTGIALLAPPPGSSLPEALAYIAGRFMDGHFPAPHEVCPDVPEVLSRIVAKMIAVDPSQRYAGMDQVGEDLEQGYLYCEGFGPTNLSLASYIDVFRRNFQEPPQGALRQLVFLLNPETGKLSLRRHLTLDGYTDCGRELLHTTQKTQLVYKVVTGQQAEGS